MENIMSDEKKTKESPNKTSKKTDSASEPTKSADSISKACELLGKIDDFKRYAMPTSSTLDMINSASKIAEIYSNPNSTIISAATKSLVSALGSYNITGSSEIISKYNKLQREILELKENNAQIIEDLVGKKQQNKKLADELNSKNEELKQKNKLSNLLNRVNSQAQEKLFASEEFQNQFNNQTTNAFVVSIDIRRSTDLMLKAREPRLFAEFISSVARELRAVVLGNYGIFDKFTGDGVLAYFPDFYSGKDAGFYCVKTANECHEVFNSIYIQHRNCFTTITKETGLGIGIDYGTINLQQIGGELVIVGTPVVYACRMASAKSGTTLLNQPAFEQLLEKYSSCLDFVETDLEIKNEGVNLAYRVQMNQKKYTCSAPEWTIENKDK